LEHIPHWNVSRIGTYPAFESIPCFDCSKADPFPVAAVSAKLYPLPDLPATRMPIYAESLPKFRFHPSLMPFSVCRSAFGATLLFGTIPGLLIPVAAVSAKLDPAPDLPATRMPICAESLPKFRSHPSLMSFSVCRSAFGTTLLFGTSPHCNNPWSFELLRWRLQRSLQLSMKLSGWH